MSRRIMNFTFFCYFVQFYRIFLLLQLSVLSIREYIKGDDGQSLSPMEILLEALGIYEMIIYLIVCKLFRHHLSDKEVHLLK